NHFYRLLFLKDEFYSREFEGFIKGFSWHNDFSSFPLNFVSTLYYTKSMLKSSKLETGVFYYSQKSIFGKN
ncbi:hypothetical protein, partial [Streptococcus dysgalactiae]|uniref:hypothetical protein n=1 Tax=Streptococcus dysgalactiae TaxID=1334 RepID=UPI001FA946B9